MAQADRRSTTSLAAAHVALLRYAGLEVEPSPAGGFFITAPNGFRGFKSPAWRAAQHVAAEIKLRPQLRLEIGLAA